MFSVGRWQNDLKSSDGIFKFVWLGYSEVHGFFVPLRRFSNEVSFI